MCVERAIASICGLSSTERAYPSPRLSATFESCLHPQALGSMRPPSARGKQLGLSVILAQGLLRVTRRSVRMRRTPKSVHAGLLHVRHAHCAPRERRSGHPDEGEEMHFLTVEPVCAIAPAITGSNGDMTLAEAFSAINNVIDVSESAPVLPAILPALRTTTPTLCCEPKRGRMCRCPRASQGAIPAAHTHPSLSRYLFLSSPWWWSIRCSLALSAPGVPRLMVILRATAWILQA